MTHEDRQRAGIDWLADYHRQDLLYYEQGRVAVFDRPLGKSPCIVLCFLDERPIFTEEQSGSLFTDSLYERTVFQCQLFHTRDHTTYVYRAQVE